MKLDGKEVDKYVTKKLSCGDCPMPCKGIVKVKDKGSTDVRRPTTRRSAASAPTS
jgi:aldehyde:ferredoxin oxidoreductase